MFAIRHHNDHYRNVVRIDHKLALLWSDDEVFGLWLSLFSVNVIVKRTRAWEPLSKAEQMLVKKVVSHRKEFYRFDPGRKYFSFIIQPASLAANGLVGSVFISLLNLLVNFTQPDYVDFFSISTCTL